MTDRDASPFAEPPDPAPSPRGNRLPDWQLKIEEASRNNVFCRCRQCDREWVASGPGACACGSRDVEWIRCWQFPDG